MWDKTRGVHHDKCELTFNWCQKSGSPILQVEVPLELFLFISKKCMYIILTTSF